MITAQHFFDLASAHLKTYGNPYGSYEKRGWGFVNPTDASQKCTLSSLFGGKEEVEQVIYGSDSPVIVGIIANDITYLFDECPDVCNNQKDLNIYLKEIAEQWNLEYTETEEFTKEVETIY